jgi:hypothetical protein
MNMEIKKKKPFVKENMLDLLIKLGLRLISSNV